MEDSDGPQWRTEYVFCDDRDEAHAMPQQKATLRDTRGLSETTSQTSDDEWPSISSTADDESCVHSVQSSSASHGDVSSAQVPRTFHSRHMTRCYAAKKGTVVPWVS